MAANSATWDDDVKGFVEYLVKISAKNMHKEGISRHRMLKLILTTWMDLWQRNCQ